MSQITVNLEGEALRDATAQAISGLLTPEMKIKLIEQAVRNILAPSTDSWNKGKSVLEQAYEQAVRGIVQEEAKKVVESNAELREKLNALLAKTMMNMLETDCGDPLAHRLADAFVSSLRK